MPQHATIVFLGLQLAIIAKVQMQLATITKNLPATLQQLAGIRNNLGKTTDFFATITTNIATISLSTYLNTHPKKIFV